MKKEVRGAALVPDLPRPSEIPKTHANTRVLATAHVKLRQPCKRAHEL